MIARLLAVAFVMLGAISPATYAIPITFTTSLTGPAANPPNASPGTGTAVIIWDLATHSMEVKITFANLTSGTTASHIHAPPLSVANFPPLQPSTTFGVATQVPTFTGFPLGVTSGTYDHSFTTNDASFFNPAYITAAGGTVAGAETALFAAMTAGNAYPNIHTDNFPGGEIRGFVVTAIPEPSSACLMLLALALVASAVTRSGSNERI